MPVDAATELVPLPETGRVHRSTARVRLGDVDPAGRQRLDAVGRVLQDAANDDATDAFGGDGGGRPADTVMAWVVRRSLFEVRVPATFREDLSVATWCGGLGSRWAERRLSIAGDRGARIESATLWVHLDLARGAPARVPDQFAERYGEAAAGRTVRARLFHPRPEPGAASRPWPLRATDFDVLGHVNNAVYLAMVEGELSQRPDLGAPRRVEVEYRQAIDDPGASPELVVADRDDGFAVWVVVEGGVRASATVARL